MSPLPFSAASSPWWAALGAPIANHLWQSTLFAATAGLLTLLLKKNSARMRYSLWLLASLKFLVPFSLLVALGSQIHWPKASTTPAAEFVTVMQGFGQPFAAVNPAAHDTPAISTVLTLIVRALPAVVLLIWLAGFVAVLFYWWSRLRHITAAARVAMPVESGRELNAFLRLQENSGLRRQIRLIVSHSALEPGILGIFHPALILPAGISDRLSDAQLEAILTHELCHVRRRDNLAAALHMLVEALFWFHPLVWWMGARLVDERERACDEEVLRLGGDPQIYAEGILKICEFYVESPLLCASGVTGSNLKKRIEAIMRNRAPINLDFARKLLLTSAGFIAVAAPLVFGLLHSTPTHAQSQDAVVAASTGFASVYLQPNTTGEPMPPFVVHGRPMQAVAFKPDRFMATNFSLRDLIKLAFGVQSEQIVGEQDWFNSEKYDVNAAFSGSEKNTLGRLPKEDSTFERKKLLQALLADRFKLAAHRETRQLPVFALVISEGRAKIQPAKPGDTYVDGIQCCGGRPAGAGGVWNPKQGEWVGQGVPIADLVRVVLSQQQLGRPVLDKTGLTGNYDFTLNWAPHSSSGPADGSLSLALEQQLGLKLEPQEDPVEVLVIDHAEKVAGNIQSQSNDTVRTQVTFESVSIRKDTTETGTFSFGWFAPDTFTSTGVSAQFLIREAYGVEDDQILGAPSWLKFDRYDIKAKMIASAADELSKLKGEESDSAYRQALRPLLIDHFNLALHRESREVPAYVLVVATKGPNLREATPGDSYPNGIKDLKGQGHDGIIHMGEGELSGQGVPIRDLLRVLSRQRLDRPVVDNTGLKGNYDFSLRWTPDTSHSPDPSLVAALEQQLGLKLEAQQSVVDFLIVDRIEKPLEN
jgi:bla regulator protein blaR1